MRLFAALSLCLLLACGTCTFAATAASFPSLRLGSQEAASTGYAAVAGGTLTGQDNCGIVLDLSSGAQQGPASIKLQGSTHPDAQTIVRCPGERALLVQCLQGPCPSFTLRRMRFEDGKAPQYIDWDWQEALRVAQSWPTVQVDPPSIPDVQALDLSATDLKSVAGDLGRRKSKAEEPSGRLASGSSRKLQAFSSRVQPKDNVMESVALLDQIADFVVSWRARLLKGRQRLQSEDVSDVKYASEPNTPSEHGIKQDGYTSQQESTEVMQELTESLAGSAVKNVMMSQFSGRSSHFRKLDNHPQDLHQLVHHPAFTPMRKPDSTAKRKNAQTLAALPTADSVFPAPAQPTSQAGGCVLVHFVDSAGSNGGIGPINPVLALDTVEFAGCSAVYGGGLAVVASKDATPVQTIITNIIVSNCTAQQGGGVFVHNPAPHGLVVVKHAMLLHSVAVTRAESAWNPSSSRESAFWPYVMEGGSAGGGGLFVLRAEQAFNITAVSCQAAAVAPSMKGQGRLGGHAWGGGILLVEMDSFIGWQKSIVNGEWVIQSSFAAAVSSSTLPPHEGGNGQVMGAAAAILAIKRGHIAGIRTEYSLSMATCSGVSCGIYGGTLFVGTVSGRSSISGIRSSHGNLSTKCSGKNCGILGGTLNVGTASENSSITGISSSHGNLRTTCWGTNCGILGGTMLVGTTSGHSSVSDISSSHGMSNTICFGTNCGIYGGTMLVGTASGHCNISSISSSHCMSNATCSGTNCGILGGTMLVGATRENSSISGISSSHVISNATCLGLQCGIVGGTLNVVTTSGNSSISGISSSHDMSSATCLGLQCGIVGSTLFSVSARTYSSISSISSSHGMLNATCSGTNCGIQGGTLTVDIASENSSISGISSSHGMLYASCSGRNCGILGGTLNVNMASGHSSITGISSSNGMSRTTCLGLQCGILGGTVLTATSNGYSSISGISSSHGMSSVTCSGTNCGIQGDTLNVNTASGHSSISDISSSHGVLNATCLGDGCGINGGTMIVYKASGNSNISCVALHHLCLHAACDGPGCGVNGGGFQLLQVLPPKVCISNWTFNGLLVEVSPLKHSSSYVGSSSLVGGAALIVSTNLLHISRISVLNVSSTCFSPRCSMFGSGFAVLNAVMSALTDFQAEGIQSICSGSCSTAIGGALFARGSVQVERLAVLNSHIICPLLAVRSTCAGAGVMFIGHDRLIWSHVQIHTCSISLKSNFFKDFESASVQGAGITALSPTGAAAELACLHCNVSGNLILPDESALSRNQATAGGVGIYVGPRMRLHCSECYVMHNIAESAAIQASGGGVLVLGSLDATSSTFTWNKASLSGGGVQCSPSTGITARDRNTGTDDVSMVSFDADSVVGNNSALSAADILVGSACSLQGNNRWLFEEGQRAVLQLSPRILPDNLNSGMCADGLYQTEPGWQQFSVQSSQSGGISVALNETRSGLNGFTANSSLLLQASRLVGGIVQCQRCAPQSYSLRPSLVQNTGGQKNVCIDCPYGAQCDGGASIVAQSGQWGWICDTAQQKVANLVQLPPGFGCTASSAVNNCTHFNSCSAGREGVMCGRCAAGYGVILFGSRCVKQDRCLHDWWWFGPLFFLGSMAYCGLLLMQGMAENLRQRPHSGTFVVLLTFYQLVSIVVTGQDAARLTKAAHTVRAALLVASTGGYARGSYVDSGVCLARNMTSRGALGAHALLWLFVLTEMICATMFWKRISVLISSVRRKAMRTMHRITQRAISLLRGLQPEKFEQQEREELANNVESNLAETSKTSEQTLPLGSAWYSLALTVYSGMLTLCTHAVSCRRLHKLDAESYGAASGQWRWWYDGNEACLAGWQVGPLLALILLLLAPALLLWRASMWPRLGAIGWEAGLRSAYERPFLKHLRHWGVVLLYARVVLVLLMLIDSGFVRAFATCAVCVVLAVLETWVGAFKQPRVRMLHAVSMASLVLIAATELHGATLRSAAVLSRSPDAVSVSTGLAWFQWSVVFAPLLMGMWVVFGKQKHAGRQSGAEMSSL